MSACKGDDLKSSWPRWLSRYKSLSTAFKDVLVGTSSLSTPPASENMGNGNKERGYCMKDYSNRRLLSTYNGHDSP